MTPKNTKLELTWIGKENRPQLEPRILLHDPEKSYHAAHRVSKDDLFDNKLIFGDNLLALKALEQEYSGKVKCIFIDPPYNTGSAFTHYEDGLEHSIWLGMMRDRLEILRTILSDDGSIWITIDDNEAHYLKVLCDEVFGRRNFVAAFIWRKVDSPNDNKVAITPDQANMFYAMKRMLEKRDSNRSMTKQSRVHIDRQMRKVIDLIEIGFSKKNGKNSLRSDRPSMFLCMLGFLLLDGTTVFPIHDDGREARWAMGKNTVDELISKGALIWKQREGRFG